MKKLARIATMITATALSMAVSQAYADADIAVVTGGGATEATTNVDLCVVVPEILIFGVGAVGDDIAKIRWDVVNGVGAGAGNNLTYAGAAAPFAAPLPFSTTAAATVVSGGGASAVSGNQADLPVFLFSNNGSDVTITASVTAGVGGGGATDVLSHGALTNTIAISDFTSGDGGSILHPTLLNGSTADTAHTAGVVNLADTWTYQYTPTSIPAAGTYSARITYVAAQP